MKFGEISWKLLAGNAPGAAYAPPRTPRAPPGAPPGPPAALPVPRLPDPATHQLPFPPPQTLGGGENFLAPVHHPKKDDVMIFLMNNLRFITTIMK